MGKKQLLFVTYHDESFEAGLSYAVDLAKTMNEDISILMIYRRRVMEKFEDLMTAVTFAEEGEFKTARELIMDDLQKNNESYEERVGLLMERCRKSGIAADVNTAATDVVSAIRNILRQNTKIDMVLLSPSITHDGNITAKELNRLVKTASRPIVTMAKNAKAHVA
ncbi:MAG: hypothetical protein M1610_05580 [Nitrospirae bacterium]|jgi:hypothetical protein|nr:hypothetical protein [Nitrospirota bacterium]MCL5063457.1 hypothetical protein [Nitrospirota bacterium]